MGINEKKEIASVPVNVLTTLYKLQLSGTEYRILLCIIRYVYFFNVKFCPLSLILLAEETNTTKRNIVKGLNGLKEKGLITNYKDTSKNNDVNLWGLSDLFRTPVK